MVSLQRCSGIHWVRYSILLLFVPSASLLAQPGGHGMHPPMPDQQPTLYCRIADTVVQAPIAVSSPSAEAKLDQVVKLPKPFKSLRISRYYPKAVIGRDVVAVNAGDGHAAVKIHIEGRKQNHSRWLLADDPDHNRLVSYIGSWRFMAAKDQATRDLLLQQFEKELSRPARLHIRVGGKNGVWQTGRTDHNKTQTLEGGYELVVEEFFPHFAMDKEADKPINQSNRRENPAALVTIRYGDTAESRWIFSKYPEFQKSETTRLPVEVRLDCPIEVQRSTPDFLIVSTGRTKHEVWTRLQEKQSVESVSIGQKLEIEGSPYTFSITEFLPDGKLVESVRVDEQSGTSPILELSFQSSSLNDENILLEIGRERVVKTPEGSVSVLFVFDSGMTAGGHP